MKTVFLSSTFLEMRDYRRAATDVIQSYPLRCVRMEDFPAKDREVAGFCRDQIKECDVVVLILGRLYGSIIPDRGISYTEGELNAATELRKTVLVFAPEPDARTNLEEAEQKLEEDKASIDEQRARQRDFRKLAQAGRAPRTFKDDADLKLKIFHALHEHFGESPAGYAGRRLPHLCDRTMQLEQFGESFQAGLPGHPEIYVVHGHEGEQHKHCVERLICFHINYPKRTSPSALVAPPDDRALVEWPGERDTEDILFNRLRRRLLQSLNTSYTFAKGDGADAFCELALESGVSYLRFRHQLRQERWDAAAQALCLNRYLPFWREVKQAFATSFRERSLPRVLVFFELKHRSEDDADGEAFKRSLTTVFTEGGAARGIACHILSELPRVQLDDLELWYDRYERLLRMQYRSRPPGELFPGAPLRMVDVERRLHELVGLEDYGS